MADLATADAPLMLSVSGCRGIVGASLTPAVAARFGAAAAGWFGESATRKPPTVVLACDGRLGGQAIARTVAGALAAHGCHLVELGVATTPTAGLMVRHLEADGGIVITASHNPAEWNGLKIIDRTGAAPPAASAARIIEAFHADAASPVPWDRVGTVSQRTDGPEIHSARVVEALGTVFDASRIASRSFHAVLDAVNCSGGPAMHLLLERLGVRLTPVHADGSGRFPHAPEPIADHLTSLSEAVVAHSASIGLAQDPDADRLALVDERGRFIGEEYTLALAAEAILRFAGGHTHTLVANLSTSRMIDDIAARHGATVHRSRVGEANVVERMRGATAILGGEGNGGVIWPVVVDIRDSLGAAALVLALLAERNEPLGTIVDAMPRYAMIKRKRSLDGIDPPAAIDAVAKAFADAVLDRQDGVRADVELPGGGAGWVHVRPSNTEPIVRVIAEAPTEDIANELASTAELQIGARG
ncbi:MAG: phosphoglucosamine mutase [Planctomycetota bacterium]